MTLSQKASYLDALKVDEHTITVVCNDGSTDGTFKIVAKPNTYATGDDFNIALYGSLMVVSVTALVVLRLVSRKRKKQNNSQVKWAVSHQSETAHSF